MSKKAQQNASRRAAAKRVARQKALAKRAQAGISAPSSAFHQEPIFGEGGIPDFFEMKAEQTFLSQVLPPKIKMPKGRDDKVPDQFYLVKVELNNVDNKVWRRILISNKDRLSDLHYDIQSVFSWDDDHMASFYQDAACRKEISCTQMEPGYFAPDYKLYQVLKPDQKLGYVFDYGDWWQHTITLEQVVSDRSELPADLVWSQGKDVEQYPRYEDDFEEDDEGAKYEGAYVIKAELLGTKEPVWRAIVPRASDCMSQLGDRIQDRFGYGDARYPGAFYSDAQCQQVLSSALNNDNMFEPNPYLGAVLKPGVQLTFAFGIEQSKRCRVTVEKWASSRGEAVAGTVWKEGAHNEEDQQPEVSYLLKVERNNSTAPVWCRILLKNQASFDDLFQAIEQQFGAQNKELAVFYTDASCQVKLSKCSSGFYPNPKLFKLLEPGLKFGYSAGVEQQYTITVEQVVTDRSELPSDLQWSQGLGA